MLQMISECFDAGVPQEEGTGCRLAGTALPIEWLWQCVASCTARGGGATLGAGTVVHQGGKYPATASSPAGVQCPASSTPFRASRAV
jgi:hypothetical protein